jgi:hypothetical protein
MNERILELARVAEQLADDELAHLERVHNRLYSFTEDREIYNKKFAELIVKECADIAKHNVMDISTYSDAEFVSDVIQQHFGV